jgi:hypothetical protein
MEKLKAANKKMKLELIQLKNIIKSSESISASKIADKENGDQVKERINLTSYTYSC